MAYELLENVTPMTFDCGRLCGNACCMGDAQTGMWLFPYEREILKDAEGFRIFRGGLQDMGLLVCSGSCDRTCRPLACRMYPFFPAVQKEGSQIHIRIVYDPRSMDCPITKRRMRPDYKFVKRLRLAVRYLMQDKAAEAYLLQLNETIEDILDLQSKLGFERDL